MYRNTLNKGFTMIELAIVFIVLAIIFAVIAPNLSASRDRQVLKSSVSNILTALSKAKSQTLASLNSSSYGVHFESSQAVIFKGTSYSAGNSNNESVAITTPATISTISLTGGVSDIYFTRLTGAPSATGSVTVTNGTETKVITISATGAASSN
jgi:prepilin-type N-terminal cleavage/methylation domain-containing protein